MPAGTEFGGQGMPTLLSTAVLEMWKSSNMAFSLCPLLTQGSIDAIHAHGSERQKAIYLPIGERGAVARDGASAVSSCFRGFAILPKPRLT